VANAVTLQSEVTLMNWRERHGGELTRIHVAQAQPLGEFDTWRQALPITLLDWSNPRCVTKPPNNPRPCAAA
jgi:precorrin-6Y C5,15-methyltransferase (decarboxylating)